jgi:hypothetical protein
MAVTAEQVSDRVLRKPKPVMHAQPVRRRALGVVEVDFLADSRQERVEALGDVGAGFSDLAVLPRSSSDTTSARRSCFP